MAKGPRREIRLFAQVMERKLSKYNYKLGWKEKNPYELLSLLGEEVNELRGAIILDALAERPRNSKSIKDITEEAADIANFAMMIADVVGGLSENDYDTRTNS